VAGELTFYFDRCFGKRFPEALLRMESPFNVEYHHSKTNNFPDDMDDDDWLAKVGAKNWIVFSHDKKWHDESPAIQAIKQHKIGCIYLWGASVPTWDKYVGLAHGYRRIVDRIRSTSKPFIYRVGHNYRIDRVKIPIA
jgi:PIN like domain